MGRMGHWKIRVSREGDDARRRKLNSRSFLRDLRAHVQRPVSHKFDYAELGLEASTLSTRLTRGGRGEEVAQPQLNLKFDTLCNTIQFRQQCLRRSARRGHKQIHFCHGLFVGLGASV